MEGALGERRDNVPRPPLRRVCGVVRVIDGSRMALDGALRATRAEAKWREATGEILAALRYHGVCNVLKRQARTVPGRSYERGVDAFCQPTHRALNC